MYPHSVWSVWYHFKGQNVILPLVLEILADVTKPLLILGATKLSQKRNEKVIIEVTRIQFVVLLFFNE